MAVFTPPLREPVLLGQVKIQETSKNIQRYYTLNRLIRDLLFNTRCFEIELSKYVKRECVTD